MWTSVSLLRLLRLTHLPAMVNALYWCLRYKAGLSVGFARLTSYTPMYLLLLHLFACGWQAVGTRWGTSANGWQLSDAALAGSNSPWLHYDRAFYWTCVTMTTVGFGDIVPTSIEEMAYTMAAM